MISIAIFSDIPEEINQLKSMIQDYVIEAKLIARIQTFNNVYKFLTVPNSFDIYIMDMDSQDDVIDIGKQMMGIDNNARFIFIGTDKSKAHLVAKIKGDYFIDKPIDETEFEEVLQEIKEKIQEDTLVIKIASGERRVKLNELNYINIVKRCLCYHLNNGTVFDGQTLRSSFEKAISPLQFHKSGAFLFLPPSLLINVGEIKILNGDNIVFENGEVLYYPKKSYDKVREAWAGYNRFINE